MPEYERLILEADTLLNSTDKTGLAVAGESTYENLELFLITLYNTLSEIPEVLSKAFFKHELSPKTIILR